MRLGLIVAFFGSLVLHIALLFGPDLDLSLAPERKALRMEAELKPLPPPQTQVNNAHQPKKSAVVKPKKRPLQQKEKSLTSETPLPVVHDILPDSLPQILSQQIGESVSVSSREPDEDGPAPEPASANPRLPPRGMISYRIDIGDSNFNVGVSRHEWEILDGHYRLTSVMEFASLIWSYRIEMESVGLVTPGGLRPDTFTMRRNGKEGKENAVFDWEAMTVRVGKRAEQALDLGAQDFLSFNYQLGYMAHPEAGSTLPIVIGKKYRTCLLEVVGDEEIVVPAGTLRTLHLRVPGEKTTDLWLAYDYLLLPVKIRFDDTEHVLVQVATQIQLSPP